MRYKLLKQVEWKDFIPEITLLHSKVFLQSPWTQKAFVNFFSKAEKDPKCVVCLDDEKLIGFVLGKKIAKENAFTLELLVVEKEFRRHGYGSLVAGAFVQEIFSHTAADKIVVHYREGNDLEKFYKKLGFREAVICGKYRNGENKYKMEIFREK